MSKFNLAALAVIIILALLAAGFLIVRDFRKSGQGFVVEPALEVAPAPEAGEAVAAVTETMPDLSRPIMVTASLDEETKNKISEEIKVMSRSLKENPLFLQGWMQLGILRKFIGDYEGAKEAWLYASVLNPNNYIVYNNLGDLHHYYLKDFKEAEKYMRKAIDIEPSFTFGYKNLHDLYVFSYKEKADLADDILLEGIQKNPKSYDLIGLLADYYKDQGQKELARKYYQEILKFDIPNRDIIEASLAGLEE